MQFKQGADVYSAKGDKVGTVDRIVVDPTDNTITHIVVEKGFLFTEDRIIPVEALNATNGGSVQLVSALDDVEEFPLFEEDYYIAPNGEPVVDEPAWASNALFYYPPAGVYSHVPVYPVAIEGRERVARNAPDDAVAVSEGTKVTTVDGKDAGEVEQVYTDEQGRITHIRISSGFIFKSSRLVPISWVRTISDDEVRLTVRESVVKDLPQRQN
jgi:uncharacterized protein YrrD